MESNSQIKVDKFCQCYTLQNQPVSKELDMNRSITTAKGSIQDISERENMTVAETFMQAEVIIILDYSGSMNAHDARDNQARIDVAAQELKALQEKMPGEIALICFADSVEFSPSGIPIPVGAGTDLTKALKFVKMADTIDVRFIVISDGEPNDERSALAVAKTFNNRIDTIFVGSVQYDHGKKFLIKLAAASGGEHVTAEKCLELSSGIIGLLESGKD
jgi:Mg-chelatase subunit ChlD